MHLKDQEQSSTEPGNSEGEPIGMQHQKQPPQNTAGRIKLKSWLNKNFRIKLSDGRLLIGLFLCTDSDANIILGMAAEYRGDEERCLGLIIVPKAHIVSIEVDEKWNSVTDSDPAAFA